MASHFPFGAKSIPFHSGSEPFGPCNAPMLHDAPCTARILSMVQLDDRTCRSSVFLISPASTTPYNWLTVSFALPFSSPAFSWAAPLACEAVPLASPLSS